MPYYYSQDVRTNNRLSQNEKSTSEIGLIYK